MNRSPLIAQAVSYFVSVGWSPPQAAGLVANLWAESRLRPDAVGDGGQAYGIAQWHPDRQQHFAAIFGKSIVGSSLDEQMAFVHAELGSAEKAAGDALRACVTAAEAGACVSKKYERPADREGEAAKRAALAAEIAGEQPAAPIEDHSTTYQPQEERPMGAIALPLLAQLIPQVLNLFSGRAQAVIAEKTGADPKLAADFMQSMIAQVGHAVSVPVVDDATATQAVGALTAAPPEDKAAKAKALEAQALATIDALIKAGDKAAAWDAAMWEAQNKGRQVVSTIAIEERKAGIWDMTRTLVCSLLIMLWGIAWGLLAAILWLATREKADPTMLTALIGLAGPIWTGAIVASVVAIVAYRFDGSKESTAQSQALITAAQRNGGTQ